MNSRDHFLQALRADSAIVDDQQGAGVVAEGGQGLDAGLEVLQHGNQQGKQVGAETDAIVEEGQQDLTELILSHHPTKVFAVTRELSFGSIEFL